ncbi:MAG TPA: DUF2927 domain-containing protein [Xanthobacteraceae bacterium]|nr:DUF2927 domain-containing protein [Xanthobacteraceae bacterium]
MQSDEPAVLARYLAKAIRRAVAAAAVALVAVHSAAVRAENAEIARRRAAQQTSFTDAQITDGFHKIAFRAELQFDRRAGRIRKFEEPVRVFVIGDRRPDRRAEIAAVVADIAKRVEHLDLAVTNERPAANFVVTLVPKRELSRTIRAYYGPARARQIQHALRPQCLSGIGVDARFRITHAEAILPADVDDFSFYDCAYEELLQGLGVINDDSSVPWTMFNDQVQMGFFDLYDQYLVNILYAPRLRPGMTTAEVDALMPEILPEVRSWATKVNPPNGAN